MDGACFAGVMRLFQQGQAWSLLPTSPFLSIRTTSFVFSPGRLEWASPLKPWRTRVDYQDATIRKGCDLLADEPAIAAGKLSKFVPLVESLHSSPVLFISSMKQVIGSCRHNTSLSCRSGPYSRNTQGSAEPCSYPKSSVSIPSSNG